MFYCLLVNYFILSMRIILKITHLSIVYNCFIITAYNPFFNFVNFLNI